MANWRRSSGMEAKASILKTETEREKNEENKKGVKCGN